MLTSPGRIGPNIVKRTPNSEAGKTTTIGADTRAQNPIWLITLCVIEVSHAMIKSFDCRLLPRINAQAYNPIFVASRPSFPSANTKSFLNSIGFPSLNKRCVSCELYG